MRHPVHPFLLVVYFFAFLFANNPGSVDAAELAAPLSMAIAATALLWGTAQLLIRDWRRSALVASAFVLAFFTYGHLYSLLFPVVVETRLGVYRDTSLPWQLHQVLSVTVICILAISIIFILAARRADQQTRAANLMAGFLLLAPLLILAGRQGTTGPIPTDDDTEEAHRGLAAELGYQPDIYLIVLDGYARADVLRNHFAYDNGGFIEDLTELGFYVAPRSTANFAWTPLSLASLLNMRYVNDLAAVAGERSQDEGPSHRLIRDNKVVRFLRSRDYRYVHVNSTFGATLHNSLADEEVHCRAGIFRVETYRVLVETTWLRVLEPLVVGDLAECHLSNFEALSRLASKPGPKFVFAHFIPPHHPYLFDRTGRVLRRASVANQMRFQENLWADKESYINQLIFVNRKVLEAVEQVITESEQPPIILIVSDHGPQVLDAGREAFYRARFANLSAFFLPGAPDVVPPDVSLVNGFRLIFDRYFGAALGSVPARHYMSEYQTPYAFVDVTDVISERQVEETVGGSDPHRRR